MLLETNDAAADLTQVGVIFPMEETFTTKQTKKGRGTKCRE